VLPWHPHVSKHDARYDLTYMNSCSRAGGPVPQVTAYAAHDPGFAKVPPLMLPAMEGDYLLVSLYDTTGPIVRAPPGGQR
jgi:hypothetical protein